MGRGDLAGALHRLSPELRAVVQAFPAFGTGELHARWWIVAAAGLLVAAGSGRDPLRR